MRISVGLRLLIDNMEHRVAGSLKMRSGYYYILVDSLGKKTSLHRKILLHCLSNGNIKFI